MDHRSQNPTWHPHSTTHKTPHLTLTSNQTNTAARKETNITKIHNLYLNLIAIYHFIYSHLFVSFIIRYVDAPASDSFPFSLPFTLFPHNTIQQKRTRIKRTVPHANRNYQGLRTLTIGLRFANSATMMGEGASNGGMLYHEVQESKLCAVHCVNTVLQGPFFSEFDLAALASDLDRKERQVMLPALSSADFESHNVSLDGDFSIQVRLGFLFPQFVSFFYSLAPLIVAESVRM